MFTLSDIEKTTKTLLLNREIRVQALLANDFVSSKDCFKSNELSQDVLSHLDKDGVFLYAGLLSHGYHEVMDSVYPGCAKLIGDEWSTVVDHYLNEYPPSHYNLNQLAKRFCEYLVQFGGKFTDEFPFLIELADYEWLELELMEFDGAVEKLTYQALTDVKQFENYGPQINNVLTIRKYKYSIPQIVDCLLDDEKSVAYVKEKPTTVAVYRDPETLYSRFVELEATSAELLALVQEKATSYKDLMIKALLLNVGIDPQQAVLDFLTLIEKLREYRIFLGSIRVV